MNRQTWHTKEDILKDLAVATGRQLHIDNNFLVVGERPPPLPVCEPDDEMHLYFGDAIRDKPVDMGMEPDLRGITQMIRQVQDYNEESSDTSNPAVCTTRPKSPSYMISISKLNPNVDEFKPKGSPTSPGKKKISPKTSEPTSARTPDISKSDAKDKENLVKKQLDVNSNDILKDGLSRNKPDENDPKDIANELRKKIRQPDKGMSTFQMKKERNLAIASLQKLLAQQTHGDTKIVKEPAKPVKLMTPDFYERPKAEVEIETNKPEENTVADDFSPIFCNGTSRKPCGSSEVPKKVLSNTSLNGMKTLSEPHPRNDANSAKSETNTFSMVSENRSIDKVSTDTSSSDPQVRDSIKKVNNWLNKNDGNHVKKQLPQICSPPPVFLNNITYKRKVTNKSPNVSETKTKKPQNNNHKDQYKPSEYAEELSKMYAERANNKKAREKNSWANLEELLKEKDEKIRQEKLKAQSSAASCSTNDNISTK